MYLNTHLCDLRFVIKHNHVRSNIPFKFEVFYAHSYRNRQKKDRLNIKKSLNLLEQHDYSDIRVSMKHQSLFTSSLFSLSHTCSHLAIFGILKLLHCRKTQLDSCCCCWLVLGLELTGVIKPLFHTEKGKSISNRTTVQDCTSL